MTKRQMKKATKKRAGSRPNPAAKQSAKGFSPFTFNFIMDLLLGGMPRVLSGMIMRGELKAFDASSVPTLVKPKGMDDDVSPSI